MLRDRLWSALSAARHLAIIFCWMGKGQVQSQKQFPFCYLSFGDYNPGLSLGETEILSGSQHWPLKILVMGYSARLGISTLCIPRRTARHKKSTKNEQETLYKYTLGNYNDYKPSKEVVEILFNKSALDEAWKCFCFVI